MEESSRIEIVACLGANVSELHAHAAPLAEGALNRGWQSFIDRLPAFLAARIELLPEDLQPVLLHSSIHLGNLLLAQSGGRWRISGLFDFGDSLCGFHEYEFVAPSVLMVQGKRELQRAMLLAYGYTEAQLDLSLRARLMLLTVLYECSDLRKYALRLAPEAVHLTLDELEASIWTFASRETASFYAYSFHTIS